MPYGLKKENNFLLISAFCAGDNMGSLNQSPSILACPGATIRSTYQCGQPYATGHTNFLGGKTMGGQGHWDGFGPDSCKLQVRLFL